MNEKRDEGSTMTQDSITNHEKLFRNLVESMLEGVGIVDWDTTILFANEVAAKILEFESAEEMIGRKSLEFVHPDSKDLLLKNLQTIKRGESRVNNEYRFITPKGRDVWIETCGTKITYKGHSADLVTFKDITNRKLMEDRILQQNEFLNSVLESLTHPFYVLDANDYTVKMANSAARSGSESKNVTCYALTHRRGSPCSGADHPCPIDMMKKTESPIRVDHIHYDQDGNLRNVEIHAYPVFGSDGKLVEVIEYCLDITERTRAEMQLKSLFEASTLINSTMDMQEVFSFVSDSVQELVGFDNFVIFLVSEDGNIYPAYASERIRELIDGLVFQYGEGSVGRCIDTKDVLLESSHTKEGGKIFYVPGMESQILVPLIIEDEGVGALHISKSAADAYDQHHIAVLKLLSEIVSSAIRNSRMHNKIKEFSQELEKRIEERSARIEILLDTKQNLQKERTWKKGLEIIVESMAALGFERCTIALVNPMRKTLEFLTGKGAALPDPGTSISLRDTEYFGVKCVREKRTIHVRDYNPRDGKQVTTEAKSFVWVPIIVQDEAFATLAADNVESNRVITEEDVKDLEILSGMCAAFIDRTRLSVEPMAEKTLKTEVKHWLNPMEAYLLIEKKPEKCFEIFHDLVNHGIPGFIISRTYPEKLKRTHKLTKTSMLWLSKANAVNTLNPDDLYRLEYVVEDFTKKAEESVILLDGLEYLVTQLGFEPVIRSLQELKDIIVLNNSRLIIPLHRETLSKGEFSILEREFTLVKAA